MSVKKVLAHTLIASAVLASPLIPATEWKAEAKAVQKQTIQKTNWSVNGTVVSISATTVSGGNWIVAAPEIAKLLGATYSHDKKTKMYKLTKKGTVVQVKPNDKVAVINGKKVTMNVAPKTVNNVLYVPAVTIVQAFGGQLQTNASPILLSTNGNVQTKKVTVAVDGQPTQLNAIAMGQKTLYSLSDIAKALGVAMNVDGKTKSITLSIKSKKATLLLQQGSSVVKVNGNFYADLHGVVTKLGGEIEHGNPLFIATNGFLKGTNFNPQWLSNEYMIVTNENDEPVSKIVHVPSRKVIATIASGDLALSPDKKKGAYVDDNGQLFIVDLATKKTMPVGTDEDIKAELTWSPDSSLIYFFKGSSSDIIASINVQTGAMTEIVNDKVKYKSDLRLSADGKKIIYTAAKEAKANYTDDSKTEIDTIDTTGTEPQLYVVDLTTADKKPTAVTTDTNNKTFSSFAGDTIVYLSANPDDENTLPVLKAIVAGTEKNMATNMNITYVATKGNIVFVLVEEKNGSYSIYRATVPQAQWTRIFNTKTTITSISPSPFSNDIAVTIPTDEGEKIAVIINNRLIDITK
ncbi:MAG: stalk domain-containing protein [Anoxybacillus gonensis]|nr:stalk domain-containing protein [Anoxybacillus gonensis]